MEHIAALGEVFAELIGHHHQLIELGKQKKDSLIKGKLDELKNIIDQETGIIKEITHLENERQKTIALILKSHHWDRQEEITMSRLIDLIDDFAQKKMLRSLQQELSSIMLELRDINQLNRQLIEQSLEYVNQSIELLTEAQEPATYDRPSSGSDGNRDKRSGGSIFDTKA